MRMAKESDEISCPKLKFFWGGKKKGRLGGGRRFLGVSVGGDWLRNRWEIVLAHLGDERKKKGLQPLGWGSGRR